MDTMTRFISVLLHSRTQAHIFHFQTTSYALHMAMQAYYGPIVELVDSLVESYQGRYGLLSAYTPQGQLFEGQDAVLKYFTGLQNFIIDARQQLPQDQFIQNQIDTIEELVASTIYKIKYLK